MVGTILIIDDEEKLRSLLARIIKLEGFEVVEAADIRSGRKKLEQHSIDVVICDVKLPDGNGVEFSRNIHEKSGGNNFADRLRQWCGWVQAMKNGAFDYITGAT